MFHASAHQTPNGHHWRLHHSQFSVARQTGHAAQQEGYGARHLSPWTTEQQTESDQTQI